jgi:putative transposase
LSTELIAALAVHSGEMTAKTMKSNNAENFLSFLKKLDRTYRNKTLHIIVDNLSVHKNATIKEWLKSKRKIKLHFTPTYASWLNQVEIWFNILSKDVLKGAVWKSTKQLIDQLLEYIDTYNKTRAKPFAWTYTGDALTV